MDVFVVRKMNLATAYGVKCVHVEAVASSFKEAEAFVRKMDLEPDPCFLFEIVKYSLGEFSDEHFPESWLLNNRGLPLNRSCPVGTDPLVVELGDIVRISPFPQMPCSQVYIETIGLVIEKHDVSAENADKTNELVVMAIDEQGFLDEYHVHTCSASMALLNDEDLPEHLGFLKVLREHIAGRKVIEKEIWNEILEERLSVLNFRQLDWGQRRSLLKIEFE